MHVPVPRPILKASGVRRSVCAAVEDACGIRRCRPRTVLPRVMSGGGPDRVLTAQAETAAQPAAIPPRAVSIKVLSRETLPVPEHSRDRWPTRGVMDGFQFVSAVIGSLAWPVAIIVLVLLLRRPLVKMLSERPVKLFEAGPTGVKVEYFDEKIEEARSELEEARAERGDLKGAAPAPFDTSAARDDFMYEMEQLAKVSPSAVILESFARLERVLREALEPQSPGNHAPGRLSSIRQLARQAVDQRLIAPSELAALDDVTVLRNVVAHRRAVELDEERALAYASLIRQLIISVSLARGQTMNNGPIT